MDEERNESNIVVKWWQVALVIIALFGFFFVNALAMESRVTKLETLTSVTLCSIEKSIAEIKADFKDYTGKHQ